MVIALFILMVAAFLIAEYFFFSKKVSTGLLTQPVPSQPAKADSIERYFHPGHSWALVQSSRPVIVGINDFAQRFIGKIDSVELPKVGAYVRQGDPMVTLRHGEKALTQVAPITGVVLEVNADLNDSPSSINTSCLEKGWIAKISARDLTVEIRNLLKGVAATRWQEAVRMQLVHWFSPRLGTVMQDGGDLVNNVSDLVNNEEWHSLVNDFFPQCNSNLQ